MKKKSLRDIIEHDARASAIAFAKDGANVTVHHGTKKEMFTDRHKVLEQAVKLARETAREALLDYDEAQGQPLPTILLMEARYHVRSGMAALLKLFTPNPFKCIELATIYRVAAREALADAEKTRKK